MLKTSRLLIFLLILFPVCIYADPATSDGNNSSREREPDDYLTIEGVFGPPSIRFSAGFSGGIWSPKGITPYEVDTYGRSSFYFEAGINHPLLFLGEGLDILDIPQFRISTNMGYSGSGGTLYDAIPSFARDNPYLNMVTWMTFFRFVSLRYYRESFHAKMNDPTIPFSSDPSDYEYLDQFDVKMHDFEIGILGSTDGEVHTTMLEIGYFASTYEIPTTFYLGSRTDDKPDMLLPEYSFKGLYFALSSEPIPEIWPLQTFFGVRFGSGEIRNIRNYVGSYHLTGSDAEENFKLLGLNLRFIFDQPVRESLRAGVKMEASYNIIGSDIDIIPRDPIDIRYRFTAFAQYDLRF